MKTLIIFALGGAVAAMAQGPDWQTMSGSAKGLHGMVKGNIVKAAEKMPEESYGFKPSHDVRSFGELVGHVADAQYLFCSASMKEKSPAPGVEKGLKTKAELVAALYDGSLDQILPHRWPEALNVFYTDRGGPGLAVR